MDSGLGDFNIHARTFNGGEVRGFLELVPKPSLALGALALRSRR
jgi:hypothetical protein